MGRSTDKNERVPHPSFGAGSAVCVCVCGGGGQGGGGGGGGGGSTLQVAIVLRTIEGAACRIVLVFCSSAVPDPVRFVAAPPFPSSFPLSLTSTHVVARIGPSHLYVQDVVVLLLAQLGLRRCQGRCSGPVKHYRLVRENPGRRCALGSPDTDTATGRPRRGCKRAGGAVLPRAQG